MSTDDAHHQIGTVAERVGLSLRTIRHYEEVGLVIPSDRSDGGFRLYSDNDIDRLIAAKVLKPLGFSLEETAEILDVRVALNDGTATPEQRARAGELAERAEATCEQLQLKVQLAQEFTAALRRELGTNVSAASR